MPPTRIGHKKSRFGCIRCKQRHVKCDEQRPCGNCVRHQAECSLTLSTLTPPAEAGRIPLTPAPTPASSLHNGHAQFQAGRSTSDLTRDSRSPLPIPAPPPSVANSQQIRLTPSDNQQSVGAKVSYIREALLEVAADVESLERSHSQPPIGNSPPVIPEGYVSTPEWLGDMHLFHHYISTDSLSLAHEPRQEELWRTVVPHLAFTHDSLMHGLLALSALHLSHIHPDRRREYAAQSARHQDIALSRLRKGLFDITQQNIHERFLLAYLVLIFTFYSIGNPPDDGGDCDNGPHRLTTHELGQSLFLGQGIMSMVSDREKWAWMKTGPLTGILQSPLVAQTYRPPTGAYAERLDQLRRRLIEPITGSPDASRARTCCMVANDALMRQYRMLLLNGADDSAPVWAWPAMLPPDFREFVCRDHPVALVLLGHYAGLVQCMTYRWHLSGWSEKVFVALEETLDERWRAWLEFPKAFRRGDLDVAIREYRHAEQRASPEDPAP